MYARSMEELQRYTDFFTNLDLYLNHRIVNELDVNQYIASFGNPHFMARNCIEAIAISIRRASIESHWTYYAPRPLLGVTKPKNMEEGSIPPRRHFLLSLTHPGLTSDSIVTVLEILAKAIGTGLLQTATALDIDVPHQLNNSQSSSEIVIAYANIFRAIAIGHNNAHNCQYADNHRNGYEKMSIRFYPNTLNAHCIDYFKIALMKEKFPKSMQLRLSPSDIALGARMLYCSTGHDEQISDQFSVMFCEDKTQQGAISHRLLYGAYVIESEPSSPVATSKMGVFAAKSAEEQPVSIAREIELQLAQMKSLYQKKLDAKSLAQQLGRLKLRESLNGSIGFKQ